MQQVEGILGVQDIEKHSVAYGGGWQSRAVLDKIAHRAMDIVSPSWLALVWVAATMEGSMSKVKTLPWVLAAAATVKVP